MKEQKNFRNYWRGPALTLLLMLLSCTLSAATTSAARLVQLADSLLAVGEYRAAADQYAAAAKQQPSPAVLFRLAFAYEHDGRTPEALWALRRAYEREPDRSILRKMDALAAAHHLAGYEYGDRYFFLTLLRRNYQWLLEAGLFLGVLLATGLILRRRRQPSARPWAGALLAYVAVAATGINLLTPDRLGREVIVRRPTALMSGPMAGAHWVTTLPAGQQVPIMGNGQDIWLPVRWQGQRAWLRTSDLYQAE
jgi:hypothetical protein